MTVFIKRSVIDLGPPFKDLDRGFIKIFKGNVFYPYTLSIAPSPRPFTSRTQRPEPKVWNRNLALLQQKSCSNLKESFTLDKRNLALSLSLTMLVLFLCLLSTCTGALANHTVFPVNSNQHYPKSVCFFLPTRIAVSDFFGSSHSIVLPTQTTICQWGTIPSAVRVVRAVRVCHFITSDILLRTHLFLQYHCEGLINTTTLLADINLSCIDVHLATQAHKPASALYPCHFLDTSVEILHKFCPSLCDNQPVKFDTSVDSIAVFPAATLMHDTQAVYTLFVMLKSVFHYPLPHNLYLFLARDFPMILCLLYRNIVVHAILIRLTSQEDPCSRVCFTLLLINRSTMLCHDFFASLAAFSAKRLALQETVQYCLCTGNHGAGSRQIEVMYSLCHSLHARFSLPWLFILIQITSILTMYRWQCPTRACISNQYVTTPSASPLLSSSAKVPHSYCERVLRYGGGRQHEFSVSDVEPYITAGCDFDHDCAFKFIDHVDSLGQVTYPITQKFIHANIPLPNILPYLPVPVALKIARLHRVQIGSHVPKSEICRIFEGHNCTSISCNVYTTVFAIVDSKAARRRNREAKKKLDVSSLTSHVSETTLPESIPFPPSPVSSELSRKIVSDFCSNSSPSELEEAGCSVCGLLVPVSRLTRLKAVKNFLHVLQVPGITRIERSNETQPIREFKGPVLDYACNRICDSCRQQVRNRKVPRQALASGLWLGAVPEVLSCLTYVERLLVARIRVNSSFIRVASSGLRKMASHVIAFESPVPKLYRCLPPPVEDLDEVLAILFTGPCKPTEKEFVRTPLLIRRKNVANALEWLKLNHSDYADLDISYEELNRYPEDAPPVSIHYHHSLTNKVEEGTSVFDNALDDGVEDGDCPFVVHGLTGDHLTTKSASALKGLALRHWNNHGGALAISHDKSPQSIYNNPNLYPQIFPWLFPYGLGGIGSTKLSDKLHKRHLLMYHDKRFQRDVCFPFVAFSHQQIKSSTTGGFLLAETRKFDNIAERLLNINQDVLENIAQRMSNGEVVKPSTDDESECFQLIRDLDHIDGRVSGSITSKKYMRSEIWSMITYMGAPMWYITLSPADNKHPICLYFADNKEKLDVALTRSADEQYRLIARNPVAGARFFHFMIEMFIRHVLGVSADHCGLYGETSGYYGTVEQQGRLTLHLHMLLWIQGSYTPDETRSKILNPDSDFRKKLIEYLESTHAGDFLFKDRTEVEKDVHAAVDVIGYHDPTETLPEPPPSFCQHNDSPVNGCDQCTSLRSWWSKFTATVNDLLLKSNIHKCSTNKNKDGSQNKARPYKGCLDNIWGKCKARFPRPLFNQTEVNMETGAIDMKKNESWLNTFTYVVTYLFRCNTDITSLRSGTAIKGVLLYVSNYVTKPALKTHVIFETVRSMFLKNSEIIASSDSRKDKARKLMTKIVNSLSAKLEIGSPMASMYLLGNPDHYTNFNFVPVYWQSFVREARSSWEQKHTQMANIVDVHSENAKSNEGCSDVLKTCDLKAKKTGTIAPEHETEDCYPEKLTIFKRNGQVIGFSPVHDYIYRPAEFHSMCLYEWISTYQRERLPARKPRKTFVESNSETDGDEEHSSSIGGNASFSGYTKVATEPPKSKLLPFLSEHPLAGTHGVRYLKKARIPNFVGNTLPHHDQGDREYYCSAMLALFKPWRSGLDLRHQSNSWDEAFLSHKFSARQLEVMKNMNIRYECLDARDDFHAQMKKGSTVMPSWADSATPIFDDLDQMVIDEAINILTALDELSISPIKGKSERARTNLMSDIRRMLVTLGWTNQNADLLPEGLNLHPDPIPPQSPALWKATVSQKRAEILEERARPLPAKPNSEAALDSSSSFVPNDVRVVNKSYLSRFFSSKEWQKTTDDVSKKFQLNKEQDRAFRIVANHACTTDSDQLKMNIAGMAGTGKSQVLKALVQFFKLRKESHRFIIVAPTGSAAALLQGSTYHSVFGINSDSKDISGIQLAQVKERLEGVHYVFLDEVSMLSCRDMYLISKRLARVMNNLDAPFGGLNFIFAGDFAQLPPVIGNENASLYSRSVGIKATSLRDQEAAIGKALWHQVTVVVILRQNMRQQAQSVKDSQFREALTNMRYRACTPSDITFLKTLISSELPGRTSVNEKNFRNVSIITNLNSQKDEINRLGSLRFAAETGQALTHHFSIDGVTSKEAEEDQRKKYTAGRKRSVKHGLIPEAIQHALWEQPTCANSKLIPGKLSICVGMPVMIRNNAATELGITKGQEAIVHAWDSHKTADGRDVLDTLFVELSNPPVPVKLDDLPLNVIPLTRTSVTTCCRLSDDSSLTVSRSQVEVLPNFAMTDYASQGKTRPYNVVDLSQARSHQSYYTALSRSATAAGTLIINGIHPSKITGGASGALRQEFRELEILDDITRLNFNEKLPINIAMADRRNTLIDLFRKWKGEKYIPSAMHPAIRWSKNDPFLEYQDCVDWQIEVNSKVDNGETTKITGVTVPLATPPAAQSNYTHIPTATLGKRKKSNIVPRWQGAKKVKFGHYNDPSAPIQLNVPLGTQWQNNSCAYDAIITVLFNIWYDRNPESAIEDTQCVMFNDLIQSFRTHERYQVDPASPTFSLEQIREDFRHRLASVSQEFTFGSYTSVQSIGDYLFHSEEIIATSDVFCPDGHSADRDRGSSMSSYQIIILDTTENSLQAFMDNFTLELASTCATCDSHLMKRTTFLQTPPLLAFDISNDSTSTLTLDPVISISCDNSQIRYVLRGVIYFDNHHFTERVITSTGMIWYHDGIFTGPSLVFESQDLTSITMENAVMAFYTRSPLT